MLRLLPTRLLAVTLFLAAPCSAQNPSTSPAPLPINDDGSYTLHAYANRIQIPTLVLDQNNWLIPGLHADAFKIRLDEGTPFAPTHARVEGDDPIAFALFLEAGGDEQALLNNAAAALDALPPDIAFTSRDRIAVYAVHCTLLRALNYAPADRASLSASITALLADPALHQRDASKGCGSYLPLYDALLSAGHDLATVPGRRVMLAIADSSNASGSVAGRSAVAHLFSANSIALFTVRLCPCLQHTNKLSSVTDDRVDPLEQLAIDTGGKVWTTTAEQQNHTVAEFLQAVRGRYILEFPRPDNFNAGSHTIRVEVRHPSGALVRPSGNTAAVPDPAALHDPASVPASPSPAVMGNRRPLP